MGWTHSWQRDGGEDDWRGAHGGKIDQVDGLIYFRDPKNTSLAIMQFDDQILDVCNQVNALIDMMERKGILPEDA